MSSKIDDKLADSDRRHFEMAAKMAAKFLMLEDEVDRQAKQIQQLKDEMEENERSVHGRVLKSFTYARQAATSERS